MNIYEMSINKVLEDYQHDYIVIIENKRKIAMECIECMIKIRKYLDSHPRFFSRIEQEGVWK